MKKWVIVSILAVLLPLTVVLILEEKPSDMNDLELTESVLTSPETFDEGMPKAPSETNRVVQKSRPPLLSSIEKPPAPQPQKEPVAAENLYFWKDYASLRTEAIRNPDSEENRAGVISLLQARQRRVKQQDL